MATRFQILARAFPGSWTCSGDQDEVANFASATGGTVPTLQEIEAERDTVEAAIAADIAREQVPEAVTPRQLRLALIGSGISPASIEQAINGNEAAMVEWEYATKYKRSHPMIEAIGQILGLSSSQIDALFIAARAINGE